MRTPAFAAVVSSILFLGCVPPRAPETPITTNTEEDPDALCAGAERVFLRHAIHLQSDTCATEARALVTEYVSFDRLKIAHPQGNGGYYHKAFSIIISRGTIEVSASCASLSDKQMSPPNDCSTFYESAQDPTAVTKDSLLKEILAEARLVAGAKRVREQSTTAAPAVTPERSQPATGAGCSKDADCKGARICVKTECVDPPAETSTRP